jgi:predicted transcriptional regulator
MVDPTDALGPLEEEVMGLVWSLGTATARELFAQQVEPGERAYTTLMTTLDRLFKKGLLHREKEGLAWRYSAALRREELSQRRVDALATRILAQHGDAGLAAFVDAAAAAEGPLLDRLEELIRARRGR